MRLSTSIASLLVFTAIGCAHKPIKTVTPGLTPLESECFEFEDAALNFCTDDPDEKRLWNLEWGVEKSHWKWRGETW